MRAERTELIVVGGGIAGMYGALCAAAEADVVLLTKGPLLTSASYLAQGGVAAAVGADDAPELHTEDTLRAGRGLCPPSTVEATLTLGPARLNLPALRKPISKWPSYAAGRKPGE